MTIKGTASRMTAQVDFCLAADALKNIERKNLLHDGGRPENAAEHSWHLTLLAMSFAEYAPREVDMHRVTQLLIIHDLVEIIAGDHWELTADVADVARKEAGAARTLYGRLPKDQAERVHDLWQEFEAKATPEARFAKALDALHPMLLIWGPGGSQKTHVPLTAQQMLDMKRPHLESYPPLWSYAQQLLEDAVARQVLSQGD